MQQKSNYDIFKRECLKKFLACDQEKMIRRLSLKADQDFLYLNFLSADYRIGRRQPLMERKTEREEGETGWREASCEEVLSICDLCGHTDKEIVLSGRYQTIQGLNKVKGGSASILGEGFHSKTEQYLDGKDEVFSKACEKLGGIRAGKGDVAYLIPLFGDIRIWIRFYDSDDEFPASLTVLYDEDICEYLFYETLYYTCNHVLCRIREEIEMFL